MSSNIISELLSGLEKERTSQVDVIKSNFEDRILEEQERIEAVLIEQSKKQIATFNDEHAEMAQYISFRALQRISEQIVQRSRIFSRDRRAIFDEPLDFSYLYVHLQPNTPKTIGLIIPATTISPENEASYLPERLKALTLEALLQARDSSNPEIKAIGVLQDQKYTTFTINFTKPLIVDESNGLTYTYEQTFLVDFLFEEAFSRDPIFRHIGIRFNGNNGTVLREYKLGSLLLVVEQKRGEFEIEPEEHRYVNEDKAADMIFNVNESDSEYREKHRIALQRFNEELVYGHFKDEFKDFDMKQTGSGRIFKGSGIEAMIQGGEETISSSGGVIRVRRRYVVPVKDREKLAHIFSCGAYTAKDAEKKYGFSQHKLDLNFKLVDEPETTRKHLDCHRLVKPNDAVIVLYPREELEYLKEKA